VSGSDALRPRIAPHARLKWDGRERRYMLLYPERGLALSDTAGAILKLCDGAHTIDAIVLALAESHPDSDRESVRADVETFLDQMERRGLVRMA
jgi:pyrroloquinoline quinone biosynthesis protein D